MCAAYTQVECLALVEAEARIDIPTYVTLHSREGQTPNLILEFVSDPS